MPAARAMRAPSRIDFGGGWTDVPPYAQMEGGVVCSVAIARYATAALRAGAGPERRGHAAAGEAAGPLVRA
ncbi:MAG: hypothetical protein KGN74_07045, partial [Gemmatimonadota bacterium]|nr:hypothetical protein [Gemmatimonadota bacterium]